MNILLTLTFRGTAYHGFQVQANALSVCEVLQNAMEKVLGSRPDVKGCSRTDSGVHALEYCVSFHTQHPIPPRRLPLALNMQLPADIRVVAAQYVPEDFHARYSAVGKTYLYRVKNSHTDSPFERGLYYRLAGRLQLAPMQRGAEILTGCHDFCSFMSAGSDMEDTVRTVYQFEVEQQGELYTFTVTADGFLYNMVRIMVGTLLEVGAGRLGEEEVKRILESKSRAHRGITAPAEGLFLKKVWYPEGATDTDKGESAVSAVSP